MKTISTLVKIGICNLVLFLTAVQVTFSLVNPILYGQPKPDCLMIIVCLLVSTFASSKKEEYRKQ